MEEISYSCEKGKVAEINAEYVRTCIAPMLEKADLSKYII